jgi:hypothetical protein
MTMPTVFMVVMMAMTAISATFGLEGGTHLYKLGAEAMEHCLDDGVRPNAKHLISNFRRQMPISQMPGEAHELIWFFMADFNNRLRGSPHLQQPAIVELQGISFGHRNRFWKVEKHIFTLVRGQTHSTAMAPIKVEGESACSPFLRPMPGGTMNEGAMHCRNRFST